MCIVHTSTPACVPVFNRLDTNQCDGPDFYSFCVFFNPDLAVMAVVALLKKFRPGATPAEEGEHGDLSSFLVAA